jgi:hypothetical protein
MECGYLVLSLGHVTTIFHNVLNIRQMLFMLFALLQAKKTYLDWLTWATSNIPRITRRDVGTASFRIPKTLFRIRK